MYGRLGLSFVGGPTEQAGQSMIRLSKPMVSVVGGVSLVVVMGAGWIASYQDRAESPVVEQSMDDYRPGKSYALPSRRFGTSPVFPYSQEGQEEKGDGMEAPPVDGSIRESQGQGKKGDDVGTSVHADPQGIMGLVARQPPEESAPSVEGFSLAGRAEAAEREKTDPLTGVEGPPWSDEEGEEAALSPLSTSESGRLSGIATGLLGQPQEKAPPSTRSEARGVDEFPIPEEGKDWASSVSLSDDEVRDELFDATMRMESIVPPERVTPRDRVTPTEVWQEEEKRDALHQGMSEAVLTESPHPMDQSRQEVRREEIRDTVGVSAWEEAEAGEVMESPTVAGGSTATVKDASVASSGTATSDRVRLFIPEFGKYQSSFLSMERRRVQSLRQEQEVVSPAVVGAVKGREEVPSFLVEEASRSEEISSPVSEAVAGPEEGPFFGVGGGEEILSATAEKIEGPEEGPFFGAEEREEALSATAEKIEGRQVAPFLFAKGRVAVAVPSVGLYQTQDDLLKQREIAGRSWLSPAEGGYSIQIMLVSEKTLRTMKDFSSGGRLQPFMDDLYLFPLADQRYLIYYGRYATAQEARRGLTQLPESVQNLGGFILSLEKVRAKIAQSG